MPLSLRNLFFCFCRRTSSTQTWVKSRSAWLPASLLLLPLVGCAVSKTANSTAPSSPSSYDVTGNWQANVTASTGSAVTAFAGSVTETDSTSDAGQYTMALLQFQGPCFTASPLLPMQGNIQTHAIALDSYTVNGQTVHIQAMGDAAGSSITGTYSVQGGCANGASGSFSANRYAPLNGAYTGTASATGAPAVQTTATFTQTTDPTGGGTFLLTGKLSLAATGCSLQAAAAPAADNAVHGNQAALVFNATDGSGAVVTLTGTFDVAAATFTPQVFTVQGGSCAGSYTTAALHR